MPYPRFIYAFFLILTLFAPIGPATAGEGARILLYHRFGEEKLPATNVRIDQFDAQLDELVRGGYQVMSLVEIARRLKQNIPLPERTVAITIDDAYQSAAIEAWPKLRARGLPLTIFVATDAVDAGETGILDWQSLRALQQEGVEIGHHGASHMHMPQAGLKAAKADIKKANSRFQKELGLKPRLFAYPYGEYSLELAKMVEAEGFLAAFGQYSSPATATSPTYALPRFAINETYGGLDRFRLIIQSQALPVRDITPTEPVLDPAHNPPLFGFTVDGNVGPLDLLACYPSHLSSAADLLFPATNRVEVRFGEPFPKGRSRINCTLPLPNGRYYWFGAYFLVPGGEE